MTAHVAAASGSAYRTGLHAGGRAYFWGVVLLAALRNRDYLLLWLGQAISFLGDQFHLIAMPWLALQLTGSPTHVGLVLAAASVPRAVLMLVGGASADRYSPRTIMLVSDVVRMFVAGFLCVSTLAGFIEPWHLYVAAMVFGTVSGFFVPAASTSIPRIVEDEDLESGNALMQFVDNLTSFLGPALAGMLIALYGSTLVDGSQVASLRGIGVAQGVNAFSFVFSAICLALMHPIPSLSTDAQSSPTRDILEGLAHVRERSELVWLYGFMVCANLFAAGPILVGSPVVADARLGGSVAFGFIMSAFAGGNLLGMVLASSLPRPKPMVFKAIAVLSFLSFGLSVGALAFATATWQAVIPMAVAGLANGYSAILFVTLIQRITPPEFIGRAMSIMLLAMFGISPISQALSGLIVDHSIELLFGGAAMCLFVTSAVMAARPELAQVAEHFTPAPASAAEPALGLAED